jgi:hypothetical protein
MKTIMDAVNDLRGDLSNSFLFSGSDNHLYFIKEDDAWVAFEDRIENSASRYEYVCHVDDFEVLVHELQNWQPTKKPFSKFERDIELSLFGHNWIVGIIYDSLDTLHEFDIQSLSLRYPENTNAIQVIDLTTMLDSCPSLCQQFECAVIAKLEEERQNV